MPWICKHPSFRLLGPKRTHDRLAFYTKALRRATLVHVDLSLSSQSTFKSIIPPISSISGWSPPFYPRSHTSRLKTEVIPSSRRSSVCLSRRPSTSRSHVLTTFDRLTPSTLGSSVTQQSNCINCDRSSTWLVNKVFIGTRHFTQDFP